MTIESRDEIAKVLITVRDYLRWCVTRMQQAQIYFGHGTDNAWDESLQLLAYALQLPQPLDERILDSKLMPKERLAVMTLLDTRIHDRLPLPYITGEAWFAGMSFKVDERVIVPRSPFAELIDNGFAPWLAIEQVESVLDLCTGSGCIGLAIAAYFDVSVDLVDLSADALEIARQNMARHQLQDSTCLIQSDLFDALNTSYDLIVSNPPYVDEGDLASMPAEYRHEPAMALGSGEDGLDCARRILAEAAAYLKPNGVLFMEVGNSWVQLEEAFPQLPFTWLSFERGGHGVCVFSREELVEHFGEPISGE